MRPPLAGRRITVTTDAVGGVWRYAIDLAVTLAQRDVAVTLLGLGPEPKAAQREEAERAGVRLAWLDGRMDWTLEDVEGAEALARDLAAAAGREGADLLHLNSLALRGAGDFTMPTIVAAHSCLATWWRAVRGTPPPEAWDWHRRLTARGLRRATVAVAPSASFAADLVTVHGPLPDLRVVFNGARAVAPLPRVDTVLAAGRWWDEGKGARALDAAAAHIDWPVEAAGPVEGPGGARAEIVNLRLLGPLDATAMADRHGRAPVFVSTSLYEPFGLAVLEAATAGAALVLSDIPTFRELWDGAALFADPRDPEDIARAVNGLVRDQALRRRLGAAAAARAARYTVERQVDALIGLYSEALVRHEQPIRTA